MNPEHRLRKKHHNAPRWDAKQHGTHPIPSFTRKRPRALKLVPNGASVNASVVILAHRGEWSGAVVDSGSRKSCANKPDPDPDQDQADRAQAHNAALKHPLRFHQVKRSWLLDFAEWRALRHTSLTISK